MVHEIVKRFCVMPKKLIFFFFFYLISNNVLKPFKQGAKYFLEIQFGSRLEKGLRGVGLLLRRPVKKMFHK